MRQRSRSALAMLLQSLRLKNFTHFLRRKPFSWIFYITPNPWWTTKTTDHCHRYAFANPLLCLRSSSAFPLLFLCFSSAS